MLTAFAASATEQIASDTASDLTRLLQIIITKIPLWIAAGIVLVLSVLVAKIARRVVENKMAEKGIEEEHKELQILGGRITYSSILILGITVSLKIAGIDLTTILAAVAFGIGFALKDLIINFLAGVMILVSNHFSIGDFIKIGNTVGKVLEIQSRTTILQAIDGTKVIVPNGELFKKQVISFTSHPFRRIEVLVGIDYRNNLENAIRVCKKTIETTKGILIEPKPAVVVDGFTDNGMQLKIKAWVDSKGGWVKVKSRLIANIKKNFDEHGIRIPWPMRMVVEDKEHQLSEKIMEEAKKEEPPKQEIPAPPVPAPLLASEPVPAPAPAEDVPTPPPAEPTAGGALTPEQPLKPLGEV